MQQIIAKIGAKGADKRRHNCRIRSRRTGSDWKDFCASNLHSSRRAAASGNSSIITVAQWKKDGGVNRRQDFGVTIYRGSKLWWSKSTCKLPTIQRIRCRGRRGGRGQESALLQDNAASMSRVIWIEMHGHSSVQRGRSCQFTSSLSKYPKNCVFFDAFGRWLYSGAEILEVHDEV